MRSSSQRLAQIFCVMAGLCATLISGASFAQTYLDNETVYTNSDTLTETRRSYNASGLVNSGHFRLCFGHYDRDGAGLMNEAYVQGNLQMYEHMWDRWVTEMGMHNINSSATNSSYPLRKTNFNFLMTWNDGGGGGAWSSMDGNGYFYAMANPAYCRYDPPSGATPHEMGHVWEGTCAGFNGSDSSGAWWECTANWMMLQFLSTYPQAGGYIYNGMYYPAHGRDYYDSWTIWEAALNDPRYGAAWVNSIWTNFTPAQATGEYILDRMVRLDTSGSADKTGGMRDLWGDMAKKMITWDFSRQKWLAQANSDEDTDWNFYTGTRTPLVKMPANPGWYRPLRSHLPQEFGFNFIPLSVTAGTTVSCNFQPQCDPVRQSDWRACLVAVSNNGDARYSCLWSIGTNSITLSSDESKLYLVVIATPKPMKPATTTWQMYITDNGLQFPYTMSFTNATPKHVVYPVQSHSGMHQHPNGGGWVSDSATVDATAYVGPNAQVLNSAQVLGYARFEDYAVVKDTAQVRDNAVVSGHALVQDMAQVYGNAKIRDWSKVFWNAQIYENARVTERGQCGDSGTVVYGSAVVKGTSYVYSPSTFQGCLICDGDTANGNGAPTDTGYVVADRGVHFGWQWGENQSIFSQLTDNGWVYAQHDFEKDNPVFAMDKYGINHGFLMNGCRAAIDSVSPTRGGLVLPLNGTSQYVELHNSVNDWRETAYTVWIKWTGSAADQRIWSMGDGAGKYMYLTPKDSSTGKLRFVICDGTTTQYLDGAAVMPANTWTHVAITFGNPVFTTSTSTWSATGTLYVNGAQVATLAGMIVPDALNAPLMENCNYLGRGNAGNYFQGYIDDFRVYMKTLASSDISTLYSSTLTVTPITPTTDTTKPTPNPETWLVNPTAISDSAITMSASVGTDASNWIEYYFTCTAGGGHDSGWISMNKYTDVGLTPGTSYTYTVKMRDKAGNTTTASSALAATTQTSSAGTASFAYGPVGISGSAITMTATKVPNASGLTEYKFTRNDAVTSGWQASPSWTDTSVTANSSYTYTVQIRDGRGNTSAVSSAVGATAKDMAAPQLPITVAHWNTQPYSTIDNRISMTAMDASDPSGVQYYFHCVSGGGPDSGWQDSPTFVTPTAQADGTYTYQYKLRDKSAQYNESGYSATSSAIVSQYYGYHSYTLAQVAGLPDDTLVSFTGTVTAVNADNYTVKDMSSGTTIMVKPNTYGMATDTSLIFKTVQVKGHKYTYSSTKMVTYADVEMIGNPPSSISGKVTDSVGNALVGATVYFKASANASVSPLCTTTTDSAGNYVMPIIDGTWYVAASYPEYVTSADQIVTVSGASVPNVNFSLNAQPKIIGTVTDRSAGGTPVAGATVCLKTSANATVSPAYTVTTDTNGNYSQLVTAGTWYVAAGKAYYDTTADQSTVAANNVVNTVNLELLTPAPKSNIPRQSDLLFSALAESLQPTGNISTWPIYATTLPDAPTAMSVIGTPTVDTIGVKKWEKNTYSNSANAQGFLVGTYSSDIAVNGATIVMAVKPLRNSTTTTTTSCVEIFGTRLSLGVRNNTGRVNFYINGTQVYAASGTAINSGALAIVSLVVQSTGAYVTYVNGTSVASGTSTALTSLTRGAGSNIRVARGDGTQTSYNGDLGDLFVYKVALSDPERTQLETDITNRLNNTGTKYTITASAGTGGAITPSGAVSVYAGASQTFSIAGESTGYVLADVLVDSVSQGPITSYTFTSVSANHTISATYTALTPYTITASAGTGGTISPSGAVTVYSGKNQTFTITPNTGYAIAGVLVDGVDNGKINTYTFSNVTANHTISVTFTNLNRNVPKTDQLLFSVVTDTFPASGATGPWALFCPSGTSLSTIGTPTVQVVDGVKWEENNRMTTYDGYRFGGEYTSPIAVNGVTIVTAVKPTYCNPGGEPRGEVVDVFYSDLFLAVGHTDGQVIVCTRGYAQYGTGYYIPDGQKTILSLVVSPTGDIKLFANGTQKFSLASGLDYTTLQPGSAGFMHYIDVGRNDPDGWSTFNGNIGDVFVYKTALSTADRQTLEADLTDKFLKLPITATAGAGGTISPSGVTRVTSGGSQTYTITPNSGYVIADVTVDSVSQGAISTYTFTNVITNHTISATFGQPCTITATAGANGSISPSGAVPAISGTNKTFTITANTGYRVSSVVVDGSNVGAVTTYTFTNITPVDHTISATFISTDFVAYWKFDETSGTSAYDWSGNSKTGTLVGSPTWGAGLIGGAVNIPGGTSYVNVPTTVVSGLTDFTVSTWVKLTSVSTNMRTFDFGTSTNYMELTPKHSDTGGVLQFVIKTSSTTNTLSGTSALPTGIWQHVAVTRSQSTNTDTLYLNGVQVGQITGATLSPSSLGTLTKTCIGDSQTTSHPHLNGLVDDFRIYNRALSGADLNTLYRADAPRFTITASAGGGGGISPPGDTSVVQGDSQTYTITPNTGYVIADVKVDNVSQGAIGNYTFTNVTAGHTISATFTPITYTITASANTGGTISPSGAVSVNYGANKTFTIAPSDRYAIVDVIVDSASQGVITSYTFNGVTANHTISVVFAKIVADIRALKNETDGALVKLTRTETVIYAPVNGGRTTTFFYIGEFQALGGLKVVDKTSDTLTIGNQVANLIGYVRNSSGIEPYLELTADPTGSGNTPIPPVALGCRSVLNDPNVPTNTVVTWGKVKNIDNLPTSFTINDGYSGDVTVMVNGVALPSGFDTTKTAIVSGVVSADKKVQAQTIRAY